jgi:hypothetical protein
MSQKTVDLKALHSRILSGELTKKAAAAEAGWSYAALCVRLSRAGLLDSVRTPRGNAKFDSQTMSAALDEALATPPESRNMAAIARKHGLPQEQYVAFACRVLQKTRSRMKADLSNDETLRTGAAATG